MNKNVLEILLLTFLISGFLLPKSGILAGDTNKSIVKVATFTQKTNNLVDGKYAIYFDTITESANRYTVYVEKDTFVEAIKINSHFPKNGIVFEFISDIIISLDDVAKYYPKSIMNEERGIRIYMPDEMTHHTLKKDILYTVDSINHKILLNRCPVEYTDFIFTKEAYSILSAKNIIEIDRRFEGLQ